MGKEMRKAMEKNGRINNGRNKNERREYQRKEQLIWSGLILSSNIQNFNASIDLNNENSFLTSLQQNIKVILNFL